MWTEKKKRDHILLKRREHQGHWEWRGTLPPAEELKSINMVPRTDKASSAKSVHLFAMGAGQCRKFNSRLLQATLCWRKVSLFLVWGQGRGAGVGIGPHPCFPFLHE